MRNNGASKSLDLLLRSGRIQSMRIGIRRNQQIPKNQRNTFRPFQNERDSLGRLVRPKTEQKSIYNILEVFENLKKSTKEYNFDKTFSKMQSKFNQMKRSLEHDHDRNYDREVDQCIHLVDTLARNQHRGSKENLYLNLRQDINTKVDKLKSEILGPKCSPVQQDTKSRILRDRSSRNRPRSQINVQLFKKMGPKSESMAHFCNKGLDYSELVKYKKLDPWASWYGIQQYELFPGESLQVKTLQKTIY